MHNSVTQAVGSARLGTGNDVHDCMDGERRVGSARLGTCNDVHDCMDGERRVGLGLERAWIVFVRSIGLDYRTI